MSPKSDDPIEQLAFELYSRRLSWYEATDRLRAMYEERGDYHDALKTCLALIQEYPFAVPPYLLAGNVLIKQRRYGDAIEYFLAADERGPSAPAQRMLGSIYLQQNRRREAIDWLERSLVLEPGDPQALYNLAGAYALERRFEDARALLDRLLARHPDHVDARRLASSLPASQ